MIRSDLLASPADSARDQRNLDGELKAARRVVVKRSHRLATVAKAAVGDPKRSRSYRVALGRYRQAARRLDELQREVPIPTRFWLLGIIPFRKVYGVPGWARAKMLLPWWARWWVVARRVR